MKTTMTSDLLDKSFVTLDEAQQKAGKKQLPDACTASVLVVSHDCQIVTSKEGSSPPIFSKKMSELQVPTVPKTLSKLEILSYKTNASKSKELRTIYGKVNQSLAYQGAMVNGRHTVSHLERARRDYKLNPRMYFKEEVVMDISTPQSIAELSTSDLQGEGADNKRRMKDLRISNIKIHGIDPGKKTMGEGQPTLFDGLTDCDSVSSSISPKKE